jgi:hypothetical protein
MEENGRRRDWKRSSSFGPKQDPLEIILRGSPMMLKE